MRKYFIEFFLLLPIISFGQTIKPTQVYDFQNYVLIRKYLTVSDTIRCDSISVGNGVSRVWLSPSKIASLGNNLGYTPENIAHKNRPNGYVGLGTDTLIPVRFLPSLITSHTYQDTSQAQMLSGSRYVGDISMRHDDTTSYILAALPSSTLSNWVIFLYPNNSPVQSVFGRTGNILGLPTDVGIPAYSNGKFLKSGTTSLNWSDVGFADLTGTPGSNSLLNSALAGKEPAITTGTTTQFWNGSKNFTQVNLANSVTGTLPIASGGTGQTTATAALNALLPSQSGKTNYVVKSDGTNPVWSQLSALETDPIATAAPAYNLKARDTTRYANKQDVLVSGTNIKTINGNSLVGAGNIVIAGSSGGTVTQVSVVTANGFSGTVSNPTSVPAITILADTIFKYQTKASARADSIKLHNQIITKQNIIGNLSDTTKYYKKSSLTGDTTKLHNQIVTKAPIASPTFTGNVGGITATMVGLGNVTNDKQLIVGDTLNRKVKTVKQFSNDTLTKVQTSYGLSTGVVKNITVGTSSIGGNLIINATDSTQLAPALVTPNWTLGTGWVYQTSPNAIAKTSDGLGTVTTATLPGIRAGYTYRVTIVVGSISGGTLSWTIGSPGTSIITGYGTTISSAITYTDYITATATNSILITPSATGVRAVITGISIIQLSNNTGDLTVNGNLNVNSPIKVNNGQDAIILNKSNLGIFTLPRFDFTTTMGGSLFVNTNIMANYNLISGNGFISGLKLNIGSQSTPTKDFSFTGSVSRTLGLEPTTTSNTVGQNLLINSGNCSADATNKRGGDLYFVTGGSRGIGGSSMFFQTASSGTTGTTFHAPVTRMKIDSTGNVEAAKFTTLATSPDSAIQTMTALLKQATAIPYGTYFQSYSTGTYNMTASDTIINYTGTPATVTLSVAGTYKITGKCYVSYSGATEASGQTIKFFIKKTNIPQISITNGSTPNLPLEASTTATLFYGLVECPVVYYTANAGDVIKIYGSVTQVPSAGNIQVLGSNILAELIYGM